MSRCACVVTSSGCARGSIAVDRHEEDQFERQRRVRVRFGSAANRKLGFWIEEMQAAELG